jgi:hypothetical protein
MRRRVSILEGNIRLRPGVERWLGETAGRLPSGADLPPPPYSWESPGASGLLPGSKGRDKAESRMLGRAAEGILWRPTPAALRRSSCTLVQTMPGPNSHNQS